VWGRCSRILSQLASDNVLGQNSVLFSVGLEPNFKYGTKFFVFNIWQLCGGKYDVPIAAENAPRDSLPYKVFSRIFGEIRAKYHLHPKKIACSCTYVSKTHKCLLLWSRYAAITSLNYFLIPWNVNDQTQVVRLSGEWKSTGKKFDEICRIHRRICIEDRKT